MLMSSLRIYYLLPCNKHHLADLVLVRGLMTSYNESVLEVILNVANTTFRPWGSSPEDQNIREAQQQPLVLPVVTFQKGFTFNGARTAAHVGTAAAGV